MKSGQTQPASEGFTGELSAGHAPSHASCVTPSGDAAQPLWSFDVVCYLWESTVVLVNSFFFCEMVYKLQ